MEAVPLDAFRVLLGSLGANASQFVVPADRPALRADYTVWPQDRLNMRERCGFIVEVGAGQDGHRRLLPRKKAYAWFVKDYVAQRSL